jgi:predicted signal transduction protein with EAL and GGDEF domain
LLRQADQAMYQAKLAGKNRYHLFDADQDRSARRHESLERIRAPSTRRVRALLPAQGEHAHRRTVIGAEALIRWQHPETRPAAAGSFLP